MRFGLGNSDAEGLQFEGFGGLVVRGRERDKCGGGVEVVTLVGGIFVDNFVGRVFFPIEIDLGQGPGGDDCEENQEKGDGSEDDFGFLRHEGIVVGGGGGGKVWGRWGFLISSLRIRSEGIWKLFGMPSDAWHTVLLQSSREISAGR